MAATISMRSNGADNNDDEPLYATPACAAEDIICEGSDTEADATEIEEKHERYEYFAQRVMRGQMPIFESARLRGPFYKVQKSEWINPWRHRELDWWKPGSKDMLFTRKNVMARARQHGRRDMNPKKALAWCRRDAKRQAEEMGINITDLEDDSSFMQLSSEEDIVDETLFTDTVAKVERTPNEKTSLEESASIQEVPNSAILTQTDIEDQGRQLEAWTAAKRTADATWLKGSYVSKRARWDHPAVASPSPFPGGPIPKPRKQIAAGDSAVQQPKTPHPLSRPGLSPKTPGEESPAGQSELSLQHTHESLNTTEQPAYRTLKQQRHRFSDLEFQRQPSNSFEYSFDPDAPQSYQSPKISDADVSQPPTLAPHQTPMLRAHPRIRAVGNDNFDSPANLSFVTDVAPSSGNLEHFEFRKKRRRQTNTPKVTSHAFATSGSDAQITLSEGGKPKDSDKHSSHKSSFSLLPKDNARLASPDPGREAASSHSSAKRDFNDESWLSTQEAIGQTPSLSYSAGNVVVKQELFPEWEDGDTSWVTTQDDIIYRHLSSQSVNPKRSSPVVTSTHPIAASDVESPKSRMRGQRSSMYSSILYSSSPPNLPPLPPSSPIIVAKSPLHLPRTEEEIHGLIPSETYGSDGSSTQTYVSSPAISMKYNTQSPVARRKSHPLRSNQKTPAKNSKAADKATEASLSKGTGDTRETGTPILNGNVEVDVERNFSAEDDNTEDNKKPDEIVALQVYEALEPDLGFQVDQEAQDRAGRSVSKELQGASITAEVDDHDAASLLQATEDTATASSCKVSSQGSTTRAEKCDKYTTSTPKPLGKLVIDSSIDEVPTITEGNIGSFSMDLPNARVDRMESETRSPNNLLSARSILQQESAKRKFTPQSPWAATGTVPTLAPVVLASIRRNSSLASASSPIQGWQAEEPIATDYDDIIRPFRDIVTPSPPPEFNERSGTEQRPSHTQLLVEAATKNPWAGNSTGKKSSTKKRVSFGVLVAEGPNDSQSIRISSQRRQGSPPPSAEALALRKEDKFDDEVTSVSSFHKHFSTVSKYRPTRFAGGHLLANSSPAVDAMAEAFIAADRDTSRSQDRRSTSSTSPSRSRKPRNQSHSTFEDKEDTVNAALIPPASPISALNETSSNSKGDTQGDYLDEMSDFLGDWSVEGELKKASNGSTPKANESGRSTRRKLFNFENVWA